LRRTPLKRTRLKWKPRKAGVGKYSGRIRLNAEGMKQLRAEAYERSRGLCEMKLRRVCQVYAGWMSGHLAHIKSRGAGGSDEISNVLWACAPCHMASHNCGGKPCPAKVSE